MPSERFFIFGWNHLPVGIKRPDSVKETLQVVEIVVKVGRNTNFALSKGDENTLLVQVLIQRFGAGMEECDDPGTVLRFSFAV